MRVWRLEKPREGQEELILPVWEPAGGRASGLDSGWTCGVHPWVGALG